MVYSQTLLFILSNEFFNLMTILLYLLSDTAALFLRSKTRVEPASYNYSWRSLKVCVNNYTCKCTSRVIRALRFDWIKPRKLLITYS